jgi:hypothetical protein
MAAATAMLSAPSRRPNAPPIYRLFTVTLPGGSPVAFATAVFARTGTCVPTHISARSGRIFSVQFSGSIGECDRNGNLKFRLTEADKP